MQAFLGSAPFARTDTNSGANARHCKGQKQIQKLQYSVKDRLHHPGQQAKAVLIAGVNYHHRKECTYGSFQRVREVVAEFVDGGVDGSFSLVVLQVLVYGLD